MTEQLRSTRTNRTWQGNTLPVALTGDIFAAAISSTLISPVLTVIDRFVAVHHPCFQSAHVLHRAVVENATHSNHSLRTVLKKNILCSFNHPRLFFNAKPFFYIWTLYAATYSTANVVESIGNAVTRQVDNVLVSSITFLSTCIVNVPLGVLKDVQFVQTYGRCEIPTPATKGGMQIPLIQPPKFSRFPKIAGATFLFRDAITIFGSFTLPSAVATSFPNSLSANPAARMAAAQLVVPVLSQILVTPVHLLGLDLYSNPRTLRPISESRGPTNILGERWSRVRRNLGAATVLRCVRIVPAFGVGGIVNTQLRDCFSLQRKC
jgi:hypothetical protein